MSVWVKLNIDNKNDTINKFNIAKGGFQSCEILQVYCVIDMVIFRIFMYENTK